MTLPESYDALFNIIERVDNPDGSGSARGYGISNSCQSNGIIYEVFWDSREQLGQVYFPPGGNNCTGIWKVARQEPPETETYDCINGACFTSTIYNTPGFYQSIDDCEKICGTGCSGKCLSNKEWQQIQDLANKLKDKNCG